jgi:hypothetical protein
MALIFIFLIKSDIGTFIRILSVSKSLDVSKKFLISLCSPPRINGSDLIHFQDYIAHCSQHVITRECGRCTPTAFLSALE